jgi:hypothetical protein
MSETFDVAWDLLKNFIGPRERVEEGKRMVEGNRVLYGQRKYDGVVIPEVLGYIDEEGNERATSGAMDALLERHPDANIRYRHDQDMSGERPPPFSWATLGGMPYPASVRNRYAKRKMREHQEKIRREMMEARDRSLRNRMKERKRDG